MEIVKNFGLDPFLFGAQIINFLIVFYLLKRFLYKPILSTLKKREDTIKEGLKQAEEARVLLEKTVEREKEILKKARESARQTIEEAKQQAQASALLIEENTKKQTEKILLQAQEQIALEAKETELRLSKKVAELSMDMLKSATKGLFDEKEQKEVLDKAFSKIIKAD